MNFDLSFALWTLILSWVGFQMAGLLYNVFAHPLRSYPGPVGARATTWWKTYVEVARKENMIEVLMGLHKQFGTYVTRQLPHMELTGL